MCKLKVLAVLACLFVTGCTTVAIENIGRDERELPPGQGVLWMVVNSNVGNYHAVIRKRDRLLGKPIQVKIEKGTNVIALKLPADEYYIAKLDLSFLYVTFKEQATIVVASEKVTYLGHVDIVVDLRSRVVSISASNQLETLHNNDEWCCRALIEKYGIQNSILKSMHGEIHTVFGM